MASAQDDHGDDTVERRLRDMNEALLISSIRQHELAEQAQHAEAALRHNEAALRAHAEELAQFNRAAVGRESRMIEIKKELNELAQRHGEAARYGLEGEHEGLPDQQTDELTRRPSRAPDYQTESRALTTANDSRRAALNLMEDAVQARHATETLNVELRESEERYRTLFDLGPVAVYTCGASGVIQEYNRRAAELWGRLPALGDPDERFCGSFRMIRPDGSVLPHQQCPMADVLCGAVPYARDAEVGIDRPDGSRITVVVNIRPLKNERGEITGAINCFYDITERKKMEQRLRDSEERYRALTAEVQDYAIFRMDLQGRALTWNQGVRRILGFEEADFLGRDIVEIIFTPEDVRSGVAQHELDVAASTGTANDDRWMRRRNGERFFANGVTTALKSDSGELIGFTKVMRDVTEQRQMQNQIEDQAERLADESRRKDEFLAMLSHELRNPLASIVNATQLLRLQQERNPIQTRAHGVINRQVAQLVHLVDDLLEVSRISTGRIRLSAERVDLGGIIQRAVETTQPQASLKGQSLAQSLPDEPLWVTGDPMRLEQVVVNLLNNAVKYTDAGGDIQVALQREGNEAVLRVRDTGVGIAPDMLPRIFDLFTQADRSLDRAQGGLGIGLALVQSLVTMHRGRVEAQSTLGEGSEFIVTLPVLQSRHTPSAVAATEGPRPAYALKILVVDDNIDAADSAALLLQARGHDARLAHDGAEAIKAALEYRPDVVLLDIGLPLIDGFRVAKRIRQEPALKGVVLVALTGYGQESDRQHSQEAGFDHHLVKPVDFAKIESILAAAATLD